MRNVVALEEQALAAREGKHCRKGCAAYWRRSRVESVQREAAPHHDHYDPYPQQQQPYVQNVAPNWDRDSVLVSPVAAIASVKAIQDFTGHRRVIGIICSCSKVRL